SGGVPVIDELTGSSKLKITVYPGYGWDNLRFIDMLPVYAVSNLNDSISMQACIEILPILQSNVDLSSTIIDLYDTTSDAYASKMIIGGSGGLWKAITLGGSFDTFKVLIGLN
ncbi:unnamed protein product, partial [Didymodactylos carnosus]